MRSAVDKQKLLQFMLEIGRLAESSGRVYFVGGSTALLLNTRAQTIDIDIKLDPEPAAIFEAIAELKIRLDLSVELASPDQFLPALPGWRDRSEFIASYGQVDFYHYDFYAQALAKILRDLGQDIEDAKNLVRLGKVDPAKLRGLFEQIEPELRRFPHLSPRDFASQLTEFLRSVGLEP